MDENRYQKLVKAIDEERKTEEEYFKKLRGQDSRIEKIKAGILLYPLVLEKSFYTIGERIEISLSRTKNRDQNHKFKVGQACTLSIEGRAEEIFQASISYSRKNNFRIILFNPHLDINQFSSSAWYILELSYDEKPYKVMREAMYQLFKTQNQAHIELREGILKNKSFDYQLPEIEHYHSTGLNRSQNEAVNGVLKSDRISIIHGPPGTGKTTTIIELIKALLRTEERILVCAPSNNAVDLIAKKADENKLSVLRIGNVTRIDDHISHLTLDEQSRNHEDWNHIKKVKIEATEAKKSAGVYKRKFGNDERAYRKAMRKEASDLRKWARELEDKLVESIFVKAQVITGTLIGIENKNINRLNFETVIIDEASQALEPECWNAILKANRVVLVGDHFQLSPTVKSVEAEKLGLGITLLELLAYKIKSSFLLNIQYRMNKKILSFSNKYIYSDSLVSDEKVSSWTLPGDRQPLILIDTSGCGFEEIFNYKSKSISNSGEYFIIRECVMEQKENFLGASIGIISPYAEQVRFIRSSIEVDLEFKDLDIVVDSIDGFQGQEKDIIILSLVRSNTTNSLGFLKDQRRLNVALTRAKKKLIIVGDFSTLATYELYSNLISHVEKNGIYRSAWEYMM